jgi:hypothetical protein
MSDAPKLLPCPFCGGEAHQCVTQDEGQRNDYDTVGCDLCPAQMERLIYWGDDDAARTKGLIAAWNTRAPPTLAEAMTVPEVRALVEAAEAMRQTQRDFVVSPSVQNSYHVGRAADALDAALARLKGDTP